MTDAHPEKHHEEFSLAHYRVLDKIGAGGMGEVFLAEDTRLDRKVALKILRARIAADEAKMRRFVLEAKTASALNHPNIITIFEIGKSGGTHFIATELIEGKTLHERLNEGRLTPVEALDVAIQIAAGLQAAHSAGIVHRDIKPENVMIRPDGLVKILDFGIAKLTEKDSDQIDNEAATVIEAYTHPGIVIGTVSYMSPEQARGLKVDARSDIFSFGILLYELLTGRQPFTGETVNHTVVAILESEPPPLSRYTPDYPTAIETIIRTCLEKKPDMRFQRIEDVLTELKSLRKRLELESESGVASVQQTLAHTLQSSVTAESKGKVTQDDDAGRDLPPNNLTQELADLIGRAKEMAEIRELLSLGSSRIITLTGIGGTGKTRLAQAIARDAIADFRDGVYFIDLSSITNPDLVLATIALNLGIDEARGRPFIDVLVDDLSGKHALLIIDNFEQVIPAAAQLGKLSLACPRLRMIVTSREVLNLSNEVEFAVYPLAVPTRLALEGQTKGTDFERLCNVDSISLFTSRARDINDEFSVTPQNVHSIAEICSRLDGLPLAIELAAARTKILSPAAIEKKLEAGFSLLSSRRRDLPNRQQTMRAAVEWSFDLLATSERAAVRQLSVFSGGFTLEAAEAVCSIETDDPVGDYGGEIIDLLTSLVEKSLLIARNGKSTEPRFRMLEVVREFARGELAAEGFADEAAKRHADYFLYLTEKAEPRIQAAQSAEWLDRLELERDNLRAALKWSLENKPEVAARIATATRNFWLLHSHLTEGYKWMRAVYDLGGDTLPVESRLKVLNSLGLMARFLGDHDAARDAYEQGMTAGESANDRKGVAVASRGLGLIAMHNGDLILAKDYFRNGLDISRNTGDKFGEAVSLNFLGDVARTDDDHLKARGYFEESLSILRKLDNKVAVSDNLNNLAAACFSLDDINAAQRYFGEALAIAWTLGNKITVSVSLDGFAALAGQKNEALRAVQLSDAAHRLRRSIGYEIEPAERKFRDAYIAKLKAGMSEAEFSRMNDAGLMLSIEQAVKAAMDDGDNNVAPFN